MLYKKGYNNISQVNSFDQKFEQLQQKFQMQNQEDLNKIFNKKLLDMNKNSTQSPLNFFPKENAINENNESFSDSTDSFTDNQYGDTRNNEQKKISYYDHDVSDLELGYTKKQSCDYYDDVKRNLNFDDDDEDETQSDMENLEDNIEKLPTKNSNQTSNQRDAKVQLKNSPKNFNGTKSLNSSMSMVNSTSSKVVNPPQKTFKKNNFIPQNSSNNSSQNRSMISLQLSPNQKTQQQGSGKVFNNVKDVNLNNTGNPKITSAKPNNPNLNNSKQRVWK